VLGGAWVFRVACLQAGECASILEKRRENKLSRSDTLALRSAHLCRQSSRLWRPCPRRLLPFRPESLRTHSAPPPPPRPLTKGAPHTRTTKQAKGTHSLSFLSITLRNGTVAPAQRHPAPGVHHGTSNEHSGAGSMVASSPSTPMRDAGRRGREAGRGWRKREEQTRAAPRSRLRSHQPQLSLSPFFRSSPASWSSTSTSGLAGGPACLSSGVASSPTTSWPARPRWTCPPCWTACARPAGT